jgi:Ca2+-binding RTX toxin-like protein
MRALGVALVAAVLVAAPPNDAAAARCGGKKATIVGGKGRNVLNGTARPDVIVAGRGNDRVIARGGRDFVCAGSGRDRISGGSGRDVIDAGPGRDFVSGGNGRDKPNGGAGADMILGGPGGEYARGGSGDDRIYVGQQDDEVRAGGGNDLVVGDHGEDGLHGGPGHDWLRGDTGTDYFDGGTGRDWVSWATSRGINVHGHQWVTAQEDKTGWGSELGYGVEYVLGSPGWDRMSWQPGSSVQAMDGNGVKRDPQHQTAGDDCEGAVAMSCQPFESGDRVRPVVAARLSPPDPGFYVLGGLGDDAITIARTDSGIRIAGLVDAAVATPACRQAGPGKIDCAFEMQLGHLVVDGMTGNDSISVGQTIGVTTTVVLNGGAGDDRVQGGPGDEIIDSSGINDQSWWDETYGSDSLHGGGGDDALYTNPVYSKRRTPPRPDALHGGAGSDQLVVSSLCVGHVIDGGPGGSDIAGFAKVERAPGIKVRIGGWATEVDAPASCVPSRVTSANEILEGTPRDDVLIGDGGDNYLIIGHGGDDVLRGLGGYDRLRGDEGADILVGGGGPDALEARDGEKDRRLSCGGGGGRVERDRFDPRGKGCR